MLRYYQKEKWNGKKHKKLSKLAKTILSTSQFLKIFHNFKSAHLNMKNIVFLSRNTDTNFFFGCVLSKWS